MLSYLLSSMFRILYSFHNLSVFSIVVFFVFPLSFVGLFSSLFSVCLISSLVPVFSLSTSVSHRFSVVLSWPLFPRSSISLRCPIHHFQSQAGQSACIPCPIGQFQDKEGSPFCKACADYDFPKPCLESYDVTKSAKVGLSAVAGIAASVCVLTILAVLILPTKSHKVVLASSPLFLTALLVGLLMFCGVVLCLVQQQTPALCYLRYWLFNMGTILVFGSLVLKTWRLHKIFNQTLLVVGGVPLLMLMLKKGSPFVITVHF